MGFDECTGEEYEWDAFRWGPDDSLDADDLEREIEERLGGYVEGKVEVMAQEVGSDILRMPPVAWLPSQRDRYARMAPHSRSSRPECSAGSMSSGSSAESRSIAATSLRVQQ